MNDRDRIFTIKPATDDGDIDAVRRLLREYLAYLDADLSFQDIDAELADLPGKYAPPDGALFLASAARGLDASVPTGCVALRDLGDGVCEMKRLFVRPECRGSGLGRTLALRIIREARSLGYRKMRLDTLERLKEAVELYRVLGFKTIPPYCENPLPGALFWELDLSAPIEPDPR